MQGRDKTLIKNKFFELIRLLEIQEDLYSDDQEYVTGASNLRCLELIDELCAAGFEFASHDTEFDEGIRYILFNIGKTGNLPMIRKLLSAGLPVDVRNLIDLTLLQLTARSGHVDCVKFLLESGADTTVLNARAQTLMHLAMYACHQALIELLMSNGVDVNKTDDENMTPLDLLLFMFSQSQTESHVFHSNPEQVRNTLIFVLNTNRFTVSQDWMRYAVELGVNSHVIHELLANKDKNQNFLEVLTSRCSKVKGSNKEWFLQSLMEEVSQHMYSSPREIISVWFEKQISNPFSIIFDYRKTSFKSIFRLPTDTFKEFLNYLGYESLSELVKRGKELDKTHERLLELQSKEGESHIARLPVELVVKVGRHVQSAVVKRS
jgi:hypothetical protein